MNENKRTKGWDPEYVKMLEENIERKYKLSEIPEGWGEVDGDTQD